MQGVGKGLDVEQIVARDCSLRFAAGLLAVFVLCGGASGQSLGTLTAPEPVLQLAVPVRTGFPQKPFPMPAVGEVIEIDVNGMVNVDGKLVNVTLRAAEEHKAFVEVLRETIADWRFQPAFNWRECSVKESPQSLKVWFEERNGKPVMSVSRPAPVSKPAAKTETAGEPGLQKTVTKTTIKAPEWSEAPKVYYPDRPYTFGIEGEVLVALLVAPTGEFKKWYVLSSPDVSLSRETVFALSHASMKPMPLWHEGMEGNCVCVPIRFCQEKTPEQPSPVCEALRREDAEAAKKKK